VVAADGKPFTEPAAAQIKAETLSRELGGQYQVYRHPQGGYYVSKRVEVDLPPCADAATIVTYPALRSFVKELLLLATGMLVFAWPQGSIAWAEALLARTGLSAPGVYQVVAVLSWVIHYAAAVVVLWALLAILFSMLANRYVLTAEYVESQYGIIARRTARVELGAIRTINLKQGIIDRLLNTGTLQFSSAGTSGVDVVFARVASPRDLERQVDSRRNQGRGLL